jgi:hypothetical protein
MQKYIGDPQTEAVQIQINQVKAKIREAKKKLDIVSGNADPGIQSTPIGTITSNKPLGKYFGRDASMLDQLPNILDRHISMLQQQNGISIEEQQRRLFNTGSFKVAKDRQGIWLAHASVGGEGNTSAASQLLQSQSDLNQPATTTPQATPILPSNIGAGTYEKRDLEAVRRAQALQEQKMNLNTKPLPTETEAQRLRRLHPELY